jgi:hypothetical protein
LVLPRRPFLSKPLLAVYVLSAALLPLTPHDLACHIKSPKHCTTCLAAVSGETVPAGTDLDDTPMRDAGRATISDVVDRHQAPVSTASGRAPPAAYSTRVF